VDDEIGSPEGKLKFTRSCTVDATNGVVRERRQLISGSEVAKDMTTSSHRQVDSTGGGVRRLGLSLHSGSDGSDRVAARHCGDAHQQE
jgi:hypothetical protein